VTQRAISENAQSDGLEGISKQFFFTMTESKKKKLQGEKLKVPYITGGKTLLTL